MDRSLDRSDFIFLAVTSSSSSSLMEGLMGISSVGRAGCKLTCLLILSSSLPWLASGLLEPLLDDLEVFRFLTYRRFCISTSDWAVSCKTASLPHPHFGHGS